VRDINVISPQEKINSQQGTGPVKSGRLRPVSTDRVDTEVVVNLTNNLRVI